MTRPKPLHRYPSAARRALLAPLVGRLVLVSVEPRRRNDDTAYQIAGRLVAVGILHGGGPSDALVLVSDEAGPDEADLISLATVARVLAPVRVVGGRKVADRVTVPEVTA